MFPVTVQNRSSLPYRENRRRASSLIPKFNKKLSIDADRQRGLNNKPLPSPSDKSEQVLLVKKRELDSAHITKQCG